MTTAGLQLNVGTKTDVGLKRVVNEDSLLAAYPVFLVADGMGGHEAGDLASSSVVEAFGAAAGQDQLSPEHIVDVIAQAQAAVHKLSDSHERGAGTTLTGVAVITQAGSAHWLVFNVGDSRVYRLFDHELSQLTVDHSLVQELVTDGQLRREEMSSYKGRNVITRALGSDSSDPDFWILPIVNGERLMLCSDGLSGEVSDELIKATLTLAGGPQQTAEALVARALEHGGRDNVSVIVIDVVSGGQDPALENDTGVIMGSVSSPPVEETTAKGRRGHG